MVYKLTWRRVNKRSTSVQNKRINNVQNKQRIGVQTHSVKRDSQRALLHLRTHSEKSAVCAETKTLTIKDLTKMRQINAQVFVRKIR